MSMLKRMLLIPTILILSCGRVEYINPDELRAMMSHGGVVIVDLRDVKKFNDGHIQGAISAQFHEKTFLRDIAGIDKNREVVIYCGEGIKSDKAAEAMKDNGFRRIFILEGGYSRWAAQCLPVYK